MEPARRGRLGSLRAANVGQFGDREDEPRGNLRSRFFNAGARGGIVGRHCGAEESEDECQRLGLCICLVPHGSGRLAPIYAGGDERQSLTTGSGRLGNELQQLLEVLVATECDGRCLSLASRFAAWAPLACPRDNLVHSFNCGTETALTFFNMPKTRREPPWWLEVGTEVCPACNHLYLYETEYRCFDCDGPLCPMCVVETTAVDISCPTCCEKPKAEVA